MSTSSSTPEPSQPSDSAAPSTRLSPAARIFWLLAFLLVALVFTSGMNAALRPPEGAIFDFFKEWASVQNWRSDMPLYTPQREAIREHLGLDLADKDGFLDPYNTHPPTANLFAIPFGGQSYPDAHFAWNIASLILFAVSLIWIAQELRITINGTVLLGVATVLLASDPLKQSLIQGQPNLLLAFFITLAWRADRRGHSWFSGASLAIAATIKIYPAYLFLYALARRDWKAIAGGALAGVAITVLTAGVFGVDAYRDYVQTVLPELRSVTNNWGNSSLLAFWERLLGAPVATVTPVTASPLALKATVWASWLAITIVAARGCWNAGTQSHRDAAFATVVLAMLLMSPTTWHHYFVLTAFPVAIALTQTTPGSWKRAASWVALLALTLAPRLIWAVLIRGASDTTPPAETAANFWENGGRVAQPWQSLTALSYQMYALLILIAVLSPRRTANTPNDSK